MLILIGPLSDIDPKTQRIGLDSMKNSYYAGIRQAASPAPLFIEGTWE